jgi:hypothetical protein
MEDANIHASSLSNERNRTVCFARYKHRVIILCDQYRLSVAEWATLL